MNLVFGDRKVDRALLRGGFAPTIGQVRRLRRQFLRRMASDEYSPIVGWASGKYTYCQYVATHPEFLR